MVRSESTTMVQLRGVEIGTASVRFDVTTLIREGSYRGTCIERVVYNVAKMSMLAGIMNATIYHITLSANLYERFTASSTSFSNPSIRSSACPLYPNNFSALSALVRELLANMYRAS